MSPFPAASSSGITSFVRAAPTFLQTSLCEAQSSVWHAEEQYFTARQLPQRRNWVPAAGYSPHFRHTFCWKANINKVNKIKLRRSAKRFVQRASCYRKHGGQAYTYTPPVWCARAKDNLYFSRNLVWKCLAEKVHWSTDLPTGLSTASMANSSSGTGTVYFLFKKVYFLFSYFRKRNKDISEGIRISLEM
jgi:hypothetical protein